MRFSHVVVGLLICSVNGAGQTFTFPNAAKAEAKETQQPPKLIKEVKPEYPIGMDLAGLEAQVLLEFIIDELGEVQNPIVLGSNNPWFERPALAAVSQWKYSPGTVNGRPVSVRARQQINFVENYRAKGQGLWRVPALKHKQELASELQWDVAPVPIKTAFPVYPLEDLLAKVSGKTKVGFIVGPTGRITVAKLLESTNPEMGQAALAMIDSWVFTPATKKDGTPCSAALSIEHRFMPSGAGDVPLTLAAEEVVKLLEKSPEKIVPTNLLDEIPKPISRRPPVYPSVLRKAGMTGEAVIEFIIDREGDAQLPRIVSCTTPEFGYSAAQAVATWRYSVPRLQGKAVWARAQIALSFER